jgi:glucose/mannose transport system permease protein
VDLKSRYGIQQFVRNLGFAGFTFDWIARPERVMYTVVMASIWQSTGFYMVLLLAGLKGVDSEVWKAAKVDGIPPLRFYLEVVIFCPPSLTGFYNLSGKKTGNYFIRLISAKYFSTRQSSLDEL